MPSSIYHMVDSIYYVDFDIDPVDNDVEEKIRWEKPCTQQHTYNTCILKIVLIHKCKLRRHIIRWQNIWLAHSRFRERGSQLFPRVWDSLDYSDVYSFWPPRFRFGSYRIDIGWKKSNISWIYNICVFHSIPIKSDPKFTLRRKSNGLIRSVYSTRWSHMHPIAISRGWNQGEQQEFLSLSLRYILSLIKKRYSFLFLLARSILRFHLNLL